MQVLLASLLARRASRTSVLLVSGRLSYLVIRYQIEPQWIKAAPLRAAIGQLRR
jgi:hypothetical protein